MNKGYFGIISRRGDKKSFKTLEDIDVSFLDLLGLVTSNVFEEAKEYGCPLVDRIEFNGPATICFWDNQTKTVATASHGDVFDKEKGILIAMLKKFYPTEYIIDILDNVDDYKDQNAERGIRKTNEKEIRELIHKAFPDNSGYKTIKEVKKELDECEKCYGSAESLSDVMKKHFAENPDGYFDLGAHIHELSKSCSPTVKAKVDDKAVFDVVVDELDFIVQEYLDGCDPAMRNAKAEQLRKKVFGK